MQDALTEIGRNPFARQIMKRVGIKPPPQLIRAMKPWSEDLLAGKNILWQGSPALGESLKTSLEYMEARIFTLDHGPEARAYQGTVFDGALIKTLPDLKQLYSFFKSFRAKLGFNHRIVLLTVERTDPEGQAITHATHAFARSLARELGPKGINVNVLHRRDEQSDDWLPVLAFLLSDHAAFITSQVIHLSDPGKSRVRRPLAASLAGKRALVTGAAQGIGYAICQRLAEEGAHVIALDREPQEAALRELSAAIDGESILATLGEDTNALLERLSQGSTPLDIIVHNAGVTRDRTLFGMKESEWDDVLRINLEAVIDLTNGILRRGLLAKGGRLITMSSVVGIAGNFGQSNYAASKAGLIGYVQGLAQHLASEGATANAVAPGFIETDMTARIPFVARQFARRLASMAQGGLPDDVADLVCFLASPCSQSVNGEVIRVCGGSVLGA